MSDRCSVHELWGDDLGHKLFTGTHAECCDAIKFLRDRKRWKVDNLTIIYEETGRHASFVIKES